MIDFVPIFSNSTIFEFVGGLPYPKSPKLGGQHISKRSQVQKSPNPAMGGGGHHHFGPFPKFPRFLVWKASLKWISVSQYYSIIFLFTSTFMIFLFAKSFFKTSNSKIIPRLRNVSLINLLRNRTIYFAYVANFVHFFFLPSPFLLPLRLGWGLCHSLLGYT